MRYLLLLRAFWRVGLANEAQYRANFAIAAIQSIVGLATALGGLAVVFSHTGRLGGWRPEGLLVVLAVYLMVGGVVSMVFLPSVQRFMQDVRQGTLDFALTKPVDAQFLVGFREVQLWRGVDVLEGIALLAVAIARLGSQITLLDLLAFAVSTLAGLAIVYSFFMVLATLTFWVVRADNILVIFLSLYGAGRWPVTIYPGALRWALTLLVPIAFAVTVPAAALTGQLSVPTLAAALLFAVALATLSRWFWGVGIRRYTGASA